MKGKPILVNVKHTVTAADVMACVKVENDDNFKIPFSYFPGECAELFTRCITC